MISEFFEWRWAPCVGLTAGSLTFVALAVLIIPTQFDGSSSSSTSASMSDVRTFERPVAAAAPARTLFGASLARNLTGGIAQRGAEPTQPPPRAAQPAPDVVSVAQRGFSPIMDRPEPPAPPPPAPEAVPPPAPPPPAPPPEAGTVIVQQPEPDGPRREVTVP